MPALTGANEPRAYALDALDPDGGVVSTHLATGRTTLIGSHPSCDLVLDDPYVSRLHARVETVGATYLLRDLGSSNGTRAGGVWLHEAHLHDGARFDVGSTTLQFRLLEQLLH